MLAKNNAKQIPEIRLDCKPKRIWVSGQRSLDQLWVYDTTGEIESHDPMDRVGSPFRISDFIDDNHHCDGDKWFLFAVVDCHFPIYDLVRSESFESAYQEYIDYAAEYRHIKIETSDLKDYGVNPDNPESFDKYTGDYTSNGQPVDTDNIQGWEVILRRLDF